MLSDQQNWMAVKWECSLWITRQNLVSSFGLVRARCLWEDIMQSLADQRGGKANKYINIRGIIIVRNTS